LALFARFIFSCSTTPNGIQFFVIMDLDHRKFMMGTELWCNKVCYHLSLMVCTFLIKRNFNLSILIFIIKLFKNGKGLVILSSIVPTIKFSLQEVHPYFTFEKYDLLIISLLEKGIWKWIFRNGADHTQVECSKVCFLWSHYRIRTRIVPLCTEVHECSKNNLCAKMWWWIWKFLIEKH